MSLSIDTHPSKQQTNAPEFTVTTSLTEGSSYQNLRIRAKVYVYGEKSGEPVAVLEQPKGISDWDFFDLLKSFIGRCDAPVGGSDILIVPTLGSQLLTHWTNDMSRFSTFLTSGKTITSAISAGDALAYSNTLTMAKGELYVFQVDNDFVNTYAPVTFRIQATGSRNEIQYAGLSNRKLGANTNYYFLLTDGAYVSPTMALYTGVYPATLAIDPNLYKVTDNHNNPTVFFRVVFSEVYENASGVVTTGDIEESDTMMFVPVVVEPGEVLADDYLLSDSVVTPKPCNRGVVSGGVKYKYGVGMEIRLLYIWNSEITINSWYNDGSAHSGATAPGIGWAMLIINDTTIAGLTASLASFSVDLVDAQGDWGLSALTINCELISYPDMEALSFIGDLGEETLIFRGAAIKNGTSERMMYANSNRIRRTARAFRKISHVLKTLYETEEVNEVLHQLTYSELPVWMYNKGLADKYREVGVITDTVKLSERGEMFGNDLEVEYNE